MFFRTASLWLAHDHARGARSRRVEPNMGHKGWHSRGYLPHFDSAETIQFVTFRLVDSLPRAVAEALAKLPDRLAEADRRLDGGLGSRWLKQPSIAQVVEKAVLHFDGQRY